MIIKKITYLLSVLLFTGIAYAQSPVFINEIQVNTAGPDWEFIELQGTPSTDLSNFTILVVESDSDGPAGNIDRVIDLNDQTIPNNGFWVAMSPAAQAEYGISGNFQIPNNTFENSSTTFLLVTSFKGNINDDLDADNDGVLDSFPWAEIADSVSIIDADGNDFSYSDVVLGPNGRFLPSGVFRNPDAPGSFSTTFLTFNTADGTPGKSNTGEDNDNENPPTDASLQLIHNIQGAGTISPMVDAVVTIEGIVVGDFQDDSVSGFYVQEEDSDADDNEATSEGIFVFARNAVDVTVGNKVKVTGKVVEFFELTELTEVSTIEILSNNEPLPTITTASLPVTNATFFERFEGMLVRFNQPLFVTDTFLLARGNELKLSSGSVLLQPTQIALPGAEANAQLEANKLNQIIIDDANRRNNLAPVIFPAPELTFENEIRAGYKTTSVTGILTYNDSGFDAGGNSTAAYRVYVTEIPKFISATNPRMDAPANVGGSLKVASFNVLNYFNGDGLGGGFPTERGAETAELFNRQRDKIINAILAMDTDIVGLVEIENDGYGINSAIQDLVNGLNEVVGSDRYSFVDPGVPQIGTDQITNGLIYQNTKVGLQGNAAILDSSVDPNFNDGRNRPSLAQTFIEFATDGIITISVNHLKSKGSSCSAQGDPDTSDGQANCNLTRIAAAEAIANWLATDPTSSGSENFAIIGDLNAYAKEDPIVALENAGYTNLVSNAFGDERHGYQFASQFGTLDYAMASPGLLTKVTGADFWNINADEPVSFDYTTRFKSLEQQISFYSTAPFRSSDHDPVIFGVDLSDEPTLAINDNQLTARNEITVFPSPVKNELFIAANAFKGATEVSIFTLSGRRLFWEVISFDSAANTTIDTASLPSGVYLLSLKNAYKNYYQLITK
ncbi:ExeM/NucH family extracellular endonuclease [Aquimarina agarivorans]|uniref:ExeM/NucH family extracellular endonuclease n=1 Tax=Aquimarina agarivorans TaxID=980584 RepID=UPI000248F619|nr:ExeM/NucH family extracellular endonuclease [Aquimarina agarivorans]